MNHYNYKITNIKTKEFYIGVRSCKCPIEEDKYMGSSSVWTKIYIKEHRKDLIKEILEVFPTRKLANDGEVQRLKEVENNPLCINKYFGYTPDLSGIKQTPEWIEKRKMFGEKNGMFGKKHTEATKKLMSEKLKGRIVSEEARRKIGNFHRGKVYTEETKMKISNSKSSLYRFENINTGEICITTITEFIKLHKDENLKPTSLRYAARNNCIHKNIYKIEKCAALTSNSDCKSDKIGEHLEIDNPDGSTGNE